MTVRSVSASLTSHRCFTGRSDALDLMPVVFGLAQWSNRHHAPPEPLELAHDGHPVEIVARCAKGHLPELDELTVTV
jgi:hypothetical protein